MKSAWSIVKMVVSLRHPEERRRGDHAAAAHGYQQPDLYRKRSGGVWHVYLRTQGVRELFQEIAQREDVKVLEPLHDRPYGETEFVIRDPNGYTLVFGEPTRG